MTTWYSWRCDFGQGSAVKAQQHWLRISLLHIYDMYEVHQIQIPGLLSFTDMDESDVMPTINSLADRRDAISTHFKVFGMTRHRESNSGPLVP